MEPSPAPPEAAAPPPLPESSGSAAVQPDQGVEEMTLMVKWSGKEYTVRVCGDDSVAELKRRICEVTAVLPKRQKLLYPKMASKLGDDSLLLSSLNLKPSVKMIMIGTVEDDIIVDRVDSPEVVDDFEFDQDEVVDIKDKDANKQKLRRRISQYKTFLISALLIIRAGNSIWKIVLRSVDTVKTVWQWDRSLILLEPSHFTSKIDGTWKQRSTLARCNLVYVQWHS